jgi:predicted HTH transcriptional regulator
MKIMIAVLVTLAILILFHVLYFTYCNLTYKGDEDGIKVSYLENHKFVNKFAKELSELDIAIINSIFSDAGISQDKLSDSLGISKRAIQKHFRKLKDLGIIKREGSPRGGCWKVVIE